MQYRISLEGCQFICDRSFLFANDQQDFESINQSIYSQDHPEGLSADMELRNYPKTLRGRKVLQIFQKIFRGPGDHRPNNSMTQ